MYRDDSIYALELERIFRGRSWNYVGLASEVPNRGDLLTTHVGAVPVILVRDLEDRLRVFVNRCAHRGAQLCQKQTDRVKVLTCPYHAWSFNLQGQLVGLPFRNGIRGAGGMCAAFEASEHGLEQLSVAERHGVVFASFRGDTEAFDAYLGPTILAYFDRVCDGRSLRVIGRMRHTVHSNWKLQIENLKDPIHAAILHSFFTTFGIWRADQSTQVKVDELGRSSVLVSTASFKEAASKTTEDELPGRGQLGLEDKRLIATEREYEHGTGAVLTIWPNLIVLQQLNCLAMRHVRPTGPGSCLKTWTFFGYDSDTPELREKRLLQANLLGPAGLVTIDDNEVLAISQQANAASPSTRAVLDAGEGARSTDYLMTESAIRGFYEYYRSVMGL